jgi:KipI family sensor histidine kinase inhibitor
MSTVLPKFQYSSDQSLIVYLGDSINVDTHHRVLKLLRLLEEQPIPGVRNLHPAYCSLLVVFDLVRQQHSTIEDALRKLIGKLETATLPSPRTVEIPVCYGGDLGPDLNGLATLHGISTERVIALHSGAEYLVYFLGFAPGFAYLGGLPSEIATPRLEAPRTRVPPGSVAIGGDQTGVYPFETPGGWRLIGTTPLKIFNSEHEEMSAFRIGDVVRFKPISSDEFSLLRAHA